MGALLIRCPTTGKEFPTGLNVEKSDPLFVIDEWGQAFCPHCKQWHVWRAREARWVEALPPDEWIENQ
jgi:hypothetical protein